MQPNIDNNNIKLNLTLRKVYPVPYCEAYLGVSKIIFPQIFQVSLLTLYISFQLNFTTRFISISLTHIVPFLHGFQWRTEPFIKRGLFLIHDKKGWFPTMSTLSKALIVKKTELQTPEPLFRSATGIVVRMCIIWYHLVAEWMM